MSKNTKQILIVEDEEIIRSSLRKLLERYDYNVSEAISVKAAQEAHNLNDFNLIISDLRLPGSSGIELIQPAGSVPVLVMTSYASLRSAVETMRQGAADYISKPFDHEEMLAAVRRLIGESDHQQHQIKTHSPVLMGNSPQILQILRRVHKAAPTAVPVLIQGEAGTGRRTIAEIVHGNSAVADLSFVTINCTSIKETQLQEQLAAGSAGTLFLNNICELPLELQPLVVKAIEQKTFRCIASTEQDLQALCDSERFRKDLFYSLNVVKLQVPRLQARAEDILCLTQYFIGQYSDELGFQIQLTDDACRALSNYSWPGNVRELQNMLYQAAILSEPDEAISAQMLGLPDVPDAADATDHSLLSSSSMQSNSANDQPAGLSLEDYFTSFVLENQENMSETALAQKLGISRKSLWERRNKLGISRKKA
jgi:DNA-binding NtrC family response regulator